MADSYVTGRTKTVGLQITQPLFPVYDIEDLCNLHGGMAPGMHTWRHYKYMNIVT